MADTQCDTTEVKELFQNENDYMPSYWSNKFGTEDAMEKHSKLITELTKKAVENIPNRQDVKYGEKERWTMDIYNEDLPADSPVFVFIHGGCWMEGSSKLYGYLGEALRRNDVVVICLAYELAPSVTLEQIVVQIKEAMTFVVQFATKRGSRGVYVSGHSAGGHLAAVLMSSEWMAEPTNRKIVKGAVLISGVFDIFPFIETSVGKPVSITVDVANRLSPINLVKEASKYIEPNTNIIVTVASHDPPKFIEQSKSYYQKLLDSGISATYLFVPNEDHFTIMEKIHDDEFILTKKIIQLIRP